MLIYAKFHSSEIRGARSIEIVYVFSEQPSYAKNTEDKLKHQNAN